MRDSVERKYSQGTRHKLAALGFGLSLALSACGSDSVTEKPPRARGIGPITETSPQAHASDVSAQALVLEAAKPVPNIAPPPTAAADPDKPPRDFSAELLQALGSPAACLKPRTSEAAPSSIDITLATSVMPSGSVAQSEVRGTGLDPSETACLRSRLETVHFAPPIENAPMKVSASLHLARANAIAPGQGADKKPGGDQADTASGAATAAQPGAADLNTGNPEVGAPPLNAPDPP